MSVSTSSNPRTAAPTTSPSAAFGDVISTTLELVAAKVDDWTNKLNDVAAGGARDVSDGIENVAGDVAEGGGAKQQAAAGGVQAGLQGKNPVWAAIKGAWSGGSAKVKAAVVAAGVALVLLLVLSPVLLLVFVLAVLIIAAVSKARSSKQ